MARTNFICLASHLGEKLPSDQETCQPAPQTKQYQKSLHQQVASMKFSHVRVMESYQTAIGDPYATDLMRNTWIRQRINKTRNKSLLPVHYRKIK